MEVVIWSIVAALGTALGGAAIFLFKNPGENILNIATGFAAGIMIGASFLGLLPAALKEISGFQVALWFFLGIIALMLLDRFLPHIHSRHIDKDGWEKANDKALVEKQHLPKKTLILATALTLHNIPEGMAVGAAFAFGSAELGIPLAIAIAMHNIPEGFVVVAPALGARSKRKLAGLAALTGLVEIPAIVGAFILASSITLLIAPALAFAAGAMVYVIFDELLPDTYKEDNPRNLAVAIIIGIILFMLLQSVVADLL